MAEKDESSIEAAIEEMLSGEEQPAKVRRKPRVEPEESGESAPPETDEAPQVGEDDGIAAEMEQLRGERDELRDRFMRALADAENARKRSDRDRREAENYGGSRLSRDMLPVYDNLSRALDSVTDEQRAANKALLEGIDLTLRELVNVFEKHGIKRISPALGDRFDPQHHEAMFEAAVPETKAGEIVQVMGEGFMLHDRLLRPAQVGVSSNAAS